MSKLLPIGDDHYNSLVPSRKIVRFYSLPTTSLLVRLLLRIRTLEQKDTAYHCCLLDMTCTILIFPHMIVTQSHCHYAIPGEKLNEHTATFPEMVAVVLTGGRSSSLPPPPLPPSPPTFREYSASPMYSDQVYTSICVCAWHIYTYIHVYCVCVPAVYMRNLGICKL